MTPGSEASTKLVPKDPFVVILAADHCRSRPVRNIIRTTYVAIRQAYQAAMSYPRAAP